MVWCFFHDALASLFFSLNTHMHDSFCGGDGDVFLPLSLIAGCKASPSFRLVEVSGCVVVCVCV